MRRSPLVAVPLAAAIALLLATVVVAGGWATVTVNKPTADLPVGDGSVIDLTVMQHGVTPVSWPRITVVATGPGGAVVYARASATTGPEGHYTAALAFPAAGDWTLTFESPDLVMEGTVALTVGAAAAPPAAQPAAEPAAVQPGTNAAPAATTTPAPASTEAPVSLLFAVILVGLGVAFVGLLVRERRVTSMARDASSAGRVGS